MTIPIYQVDAFTDHTFGGNPAAVCPLEQWLPEGVMQQIAAENNLSETAFIVPVADAYEIRWFTPILEVDLCGHATLATAHVYFEELNVRVNQLVFKSKSGPLTVKKVPEGYAMNFPKDTLQPIPITELMKNGLGESPVAAYSGKFDYLLIVKEEATVIALRPDFNLLNQLPARGVIVSAKGSDVDFVSRFFAPQVGIDEDPVTGSAHTTLTPYWADKLGKTFLTAKQLSKRSGTLQCRLLGERVEIIGQAVTYLKGNIKI